MMDSLKTEGLRGYLTAVRRMRGHMPAHKEFAYTCIEDWLLQHGEEMAPPSCWTQAETARKEAISRMINPQSKECFGNCQRAMLHFHDVAYVEGYTLSGIPLPHAWLLLGGKLWDPTLELLPYPPPTVYYGAVFPPYVVTAMMIGTRSHGSVLDNYEQRWPLLRTPWKGGI